MHCSSCCCFRLCLLAPYRRRLGGMLITRTHPGPAESVHEVLHNQGSRRPVPARALDGTGSGEQVCHGLRPYWLRTPPTTSSCGARATGDFPECNLQTSTRPGAILGDVMMMVTRRDFHQPVRGTRSVPHSAQHMPIATQKLRTLPGQRADSSRDLACNTGSARGSPEHKVPFVSMSQAGRRVGQVSISPSKLTQNPALRTW